jgi:hypothetical protein
MDKENELRQALNFLSNNWRHNEHLREAFESIRQQLNAGTKSDKANAETLREYLSYPGSKSALSSSESLLASIKELDGRRAAGLVRKGRGKKHDPAKVKMEDGVMQVMIAYLLKRAKKWEIDSAILERVGEDADPATIRKYRKELEARAQTFVVGYKKFQGSFGSKKPLWNEPEISVKTENNR